MWASFFIVWRESVEALLVIGILYAWIKREHNAHGLSQLWLGGLLGLGLAGVLALAIFYAGEWYSGPGGEWFRTAMMVVASLLIMQMVIWMQRHGRTMKRDLEQAARAKMASSSGLGLMLLAALAVGREGSETVVFLTGTMGQATSLGAFILGAVLGLVGAIITFLLLQIFSHIIAWKWFFRFSAFVLLLLGGALLVAASDKMVGQLADWDGLPEWAFDVMYEPLWDTSWLLADARGTWAGLVGYHASPSLSQFMPLMLYWLCACLFFITGKGKMVAKPALEQNAIQ